MVLLMPTIRLRVVACGTALVCTGLRGGLLQESAVAVAVPMATRPSHIKLPITRSRRVVIDQPVCCVEVEATTERETVHLEVPQLADFVFLNRGAPEHPAELVIFAILGIWTSVCFEETSAGCEDVLVSHEEVPNAGDECSLWVEGILDTDLMQNLLQLSCLTDSSRPDSHRVLLHNDLSWSRCQGSSPKMYQEVLGLDGSMIALHILVEPGNRGFHLDDV
mmetsp:Transcript_88155/g.193344  ORF Transcript_88155/g.193344 Transcript_88155/m.193344 type:complete len:221 (-) Transcript_88155:1265-1927(-)